jgi:hypothetical protein
LNTDFTIDIYKKLLHELISQQYLFQTFSDYLKNPGERVIILRHDVDLMPGNSLRFARIQSELGIKGSYYFRAVKESWDEAVIKEIAALGHEVGYHYESLTTVGRRGLNSGNGLMESGIEDFLKNLSKLRELVQVETICMHGSPESSYDSKDLWKYYNYTDYKIIGEPYFDIDFKNVFYLTDTGRRWDGHKVSVRDKIDEEQMAWIDKGMLFRSTAEIINALQDRVMPERIMMTFHPQRWNDKNWFWYKELIMQNIKNPIKKLLIDLRKQGILK